MVLPLAILLAAINNFSAANFDAPYRFSGLTALSEDKAITFTLLFIAALIIFSAPIIFVLIHSSDCIQISLLVS